MHDEKDAFLGLRLPRSLKAAVASLANVAGVSISEMVRLLLARDIYVNGLDAAAFAQQVGIERYGPVDTARRAKLERMRLEFIMAGSAVETEDGSLQSTLAPTAATAGETAPQEEHETVPV